MNNPLFYYRNGVVMRNHWIRNGHPNDHKAKHVRMGKSRGRKIGLEEAGWVGMFDQDDDVNYDFTVVAHQEMLMEVLQARLELIIMLYDARLEHHG